ncbi:hypothetical protein SARC_17661, partial [Sphaeroforma arctica JP610]
MERAERDGSLSFLNRHPTGTVGIHYGTTGRRDPIVSLPLGPGHPYITCSDTRIVIRQVEHVRVMGTNILLVGSSPKRPRGVVRRHASILSRQ